MTYEEIRAMGMMVVGAWVRKSICGDGNTLDIFMLLFSILLFGSWPGTNGVGTGFYLLRITAKWRWSFRVRRIRRKVGIKL